jgi:hypothetical protein
MHVLVRLPARHVLPLLLLPVSGGCVSGGGGGLLLVVWHVCG